MWLPIWFKRLKSNWFSRRLAASIAPRRRGRRQPAVRPEVDALEDRYAPALRAALGQLKNLYLDIKEADAALHELALLNDLQELNLNRIMPKAASSEELQAPRHPAKR